MIKFALITGALFSALSVMIGAFGAHALNDTLIANARTDTFETAVRYQMFHSLAILVAALIMKGNPSAMFDWAVYLFIAGIIIFSGSLYILSITNITWFGAITPIGGLAFIAGWIVLVLAFIKLKI